MSVVHRNDQASRYLLASPTRDPDAKRLRCRPLREQRPTSGSRTGCLRTWRSTVDRSLPEPASGTAGPGSAVDAAMVDRIPSLGSARAAARIQSACRRSGRSGSIGVEVPGVSRRANDGRRPGGVGETDGWIEDGVPPCSRRPAASAAPCSCPRDGQRLDGVEANASGAVYDADHRPGLTPAAHRPGSCMDD